jgi:hypothetical protein
MKLKITRECATPGRLFTAGETVDVNDQLGEALLRAESAEPLAESADGPPAEPRPAAGPASRRRPETT